MINKLICIISLKEFGKDYVRTKQLISIPVAVNYCPFVCMCYLFKYRMPLISPMGLMALQLTTQLSTLILLLEAGVAQLPSQLPLVEEMFVIMSLTSLHHHLVLPLLASL